MNKEKIVSLTKYVNSMKDKLAAPVPAKHVGGEAAYKAFINNEIRLHSAKLERALMDAPAKK